MQTLQTALAMLVCVGSLHLAQTTPAADATASIAPADAPAVSLIGDSTMAAMLWYSTSTEDIRSIVGDSYRLTFDAESCRRLVNPSCRGRNGTYPLSVLPLMRTTLKGRIGEAMVVMAGYDDSSIGGAVDQVMAEAEAQGVVRVLWLNYPTNTAYVLPGGAAARTLYDSHNAELAQAGQRHGSLQVLDWNGFSVGRSNWFASDGIHLNPDGARGLATFIKNALDAQTAIGGCRAASARTGTFEGAPSAAPPVPASDAGFVQLVPQRVLDTRDPEVGGGVGKVGAGRTVSVDVSTIAPADTLAAAFSVTAVDSCLPGYLTVYACGARPPTSNVNYEVGRTTAGMAITPLTSGRVCVFASSATDLVVDIIGAFTPGGDRFHPMTPTRWIDTRGASVQLPEITGERSAPTETQLAIRGQGGVPAGATAVWANLTIADPVASTVLGAYPGPCGKPPLASNVNARPQHSTASSILVGLGPDGSICVRTFAGRSQIVVDVAGWFGPGAGGLVYRVRTPVRLLDTRSNDGTPTTTEQPVPLSAVSVLNVAAADSSGLGFVTVRPCGSMLISSLVNTSPRENTANITAVGAGSNGSVCVRSSITSHLVVDQIATFVPGE